jgi:hypothetical protein
MYSITPKKIFNSFFRNEYPKYAEFHADFKSLEIMEKVHPEKVICYKPLRVKSIEEEKFQFCTLFLPASFLLANFSNFSQQFLNQRIILRCIHIHIQIL